MTGVDAPPQIPLPTIAHAFGAIRQNNRLTALKISEIGQQNETTLNIAQRILETENLKLVQQILKIERNTEKLKRKYTRILKKFDRIPLVFPEKHSPSVAFFAPTFYGGENFSSLNPWVCGFQHLPAKYNDHENLIHRLRTENINLEREKRNRKQYKAALKHKIDKLKQSYKKRIKELKVKMAGESVVVLAEVVNQVNHHKRRNMLKKEFKGKKKLYIDWAPPMPEDYKQSTDDATEREIMRLGDMIRETRSAIYPDDITQLSVEIQGKREEISGSVAREMKRLTSPLQKLSDEIQEAKDKIEKRLSGQ